MRKGSIGVRGATIGLDLGDRFAEGRVLDSSGEVVEAFRVRTTERALAARLAGLPPCRVVLEVGTHSPWVSRTVTRLPSSSTEAFPERVRATTAMDLFPGLETLLATNGQLMATDGQLDRDVERLCGDG